MSHVIRRTAIVLLAVSGCGIRPSSPPASVIPSAAPTATSTRTAAPSSPATVVRGEPWIVYEGGEEAAGPTPIRLVRPDGSDDHLVLTRPLPFDDQGHPAWSPDGASIAFDAFTSDPAIPEKDHVAIWVTAADGGERHPLVSCELPCLQVAYPAWSPDGREVAFIRHDLTPSQDWGPSAVEILEVASGAMRVIAQTADGLSAYYTPRWSSDGRSVVLGIETYADATEEHIVGSVIAIVATDGLGKPKVLTDPALFAGEPDWAPSEQIVFTIGEHKDVDAEIMIMRSDGSDQRQLVAFGPGGGEAIEATWLPDASRVMFDFVAPDGSQAVAFVNPDGSGVQILPWNIHTAPGAQRAHIHFRPT